MTEDFDTVHQCFNLETGEQLECSLENFIENDKLIQITDERRPVFNDRGEYLGYSFDGKFHDQRKHCQNCMRLLTTGDNLYCSRLCEEADILSYVKPEQDSGHAVTQIEAKVTQEA